MLSRPTATSANVGFSQVVQLLAPPKTLLQHLAEKIPFWATVSKMVCSMLSIRCLSVLSVCNVGACGQTVGWIKTKLGVQVGFGPGHIVFDGDPPPLPQRGTAPHFRPISVAAKWLDGSRW